MKLALYQEIALNRDFPNYNLCKGDMAILIDYVPHPDQGEEGALIEVFNALGSVEMGSVSSIDALQPNDIPSIRRLVQVS